MRLSLETATRAPFDVSEVYGPALNTSSSVKACICRVAPSSIYAGFGLLHLLEDIGKLIFSTL